MYHTALGRKIQHNIHIFVTLFVSSGMFPVRFPLRGGENSPAVLGNGRGVFFVFSYQSSWTVSPRTILPYSTSMGCRAATSSSMALIFSFTQSLWAHTFHWGWLPTKYMM